MFEILLFLGLVSSPELEIPPNTTVEAVEQPLFAPILHDEAVQATSTLPEDDRTLIERAKEPFCSCIAYVRAISQFQPERVDNALEIPVNSYEPKVGYWALFDYEPYGHASFVSEVGTSTIEVLEFNKTPCKEGRRIVNKKDAHLRGYFGDD